MPLVIATFYKFVTLSDCAEMQSEMLAHCELHGVKGTILLAAEGINGTIAGTRAAIDSLLVFLKSDPRFAALEHKESFAQKYPFERLKVKVKQEIVSLGKPDVNPGEQTGVYVSPQAWNELISDPDVTVVDTRNDYEVRIGTFQNAINPETAAFRDFPDYAETNLDPTRHKKIAMFCTGGIRCEKASAYLLNQGFQEVYHLKGGILKYLEEVPVESSLWQGECFVFDDRIAVKSGLEPGSYEMCRSCGHPISDDDKTSPAYVEGISCPDCVDTLTPEKRDRQQERQRQFEMKRVE